MFESSIVIERGYRGSFTFNIVSSKSISKIERIEIDVIKSYQCVMVPTKIEALMIPNQYELTVVPDFDTYPLPPLSPEATNWVLKGEDFENYSVSLDWVSSHAIDIQVQCELRNILTNSKHIITSETLHCIKNGFKIIDKDVSFTYGRASLADELSENLYKSLISKDYSYLERLKKSDEQNILEEILIYTGCNEINKKKISVFDMKCHPALAEKLMSLYQHIIINAVKEESIFIFRPSLYGVGIKLDILWEKLKKFKEGLSQRRRTDNADSI